jgi:hypothetical protein
MRGLGYRPPSLSLRGLVSAPISRLTDWIQYHKAHLVKQECGLRVGVGKDDKFLALTAAFPGQRGRDPVARAPWQHSRRHIPESPPTMRPNAPTMSRSVAPAAHPAGQRLEVAGTRTGLLHRLDKGLADGADGAVGNAVDLGADVRFDERGVETEPADGGASRRPRCAKRRSQCNPFSQRRRGAEPRQHRRHRIPCCAGATQASRADAGDARRPAKDRSVDRPGRRVGWPGEPTRPGLTLRL